MEIRYSKKAVKYIDKQDKPTKIAIKRAIENLPSGNVSPYKGHDIITHRLRIGNHRVLYYYELANVIYVEKIGPRGDVYKGV
ncbi:MAG: type II toxin-antitoxin system RelE/ParE family toxin [Defluviitaleaceae bacterium]|nr:type II toxin-antitoxin system RelE/ParE family toxin [Defluviitaleaceae bacterium]